MIRERISLDGVWDFQFDPKDSLSPENPGPWRKIIVPGSWQAQFEDLRDRSGTGWYRKLIRIPKNWKNMAPILHFGAVDYYAQIWIGDQAIGEHEGGYLPFEFDLSPWSQDINELELIVRVVDPTNDPERFPKFPFSEIPHGKQSWYGPMSGIWQSVWLECRSHLHVQWLHLTPDLKRGYVHLTFDLSKAAERPCEIGVELLDLNLRPVASAVFPIPKGKKRIHLQQTVDHPLPWSPDQPYLYQCRIQLYEQGVLLDQVCENFGFRTIETRDGKLILNGKPIYLRGALDQDYYPDTVYTPPSESYLEDQFRQVKALGFNCLRCHMKIPDPCYYNVADRVGMLVWAEFPSWRLLSPEAAQRVYNTWKGILARDWNHPSIFAWTIINEGWGVDLVNDKSHRFWLLSTYQWLKKRDPLRLIVDNSPCHPNFHIQTDLCDYHLYKAIPDHRRLWDAQVGEVSQRASWLFGPPNESKPSGEEPLLISEFGNWGLPNAEQMIEKEGKEPWWFESGSEWEEGTVYPHGVFKRFRTWGMDKVFTSVQALFEATQWHQYRALKYQIESMRCRPEIAGYVVTQLTDVYWECNGLFDLYRNPKAYTHRLATINTDLLVIPRWERVAYWSGESIEIPLVIASGIHPPFEHAEIHWRLEPSDLKGSSIGFELDTYQVGEIGKVAFVAPQVTTPSLYTLTLELRSSDGHLLSANDLALVVFPRQRKIINPWKRLWTSDEHLAEYLTALGYHLSNDPRSAQILVANQLSGMEISYLREGGRLLALLDQPSSLLAEFGVEVVPREGTPWQGDWATSFSWLRRDRHFADFPGDPLLDYSFDRVIPHCVLLGFKPLEFEAQVHAGLFVGWIHKPVALIAERKFGKGKGVLTTFRLTVDPPGYDPIATSLLDSLIRLTVDK
jgi:hypothetical protein